MKITGLQQQDIASQIFNISDKNLSNKIRRNTIDLFTIFNWASNEKVDLNWLISGKGSPRLQKNHNPDNVTGIDSCVEILNEALDETDTHDLVTPEMRENLVKLMREEIAEQEVRTKNKFIRLIGTFIGSEARK